MAVSHECDFPETANDRPRVTHCPIHRSNLASNEVDAWLRRALHENGTIYTIDEPLLRKLRPDVILTQKLCDVCAVGYGTVTRLAETLPGPPMVLNLEPSSLADILDNIRQVAEVCGVPERADTSARNYPLGWKRCESAPRKFSYRPRCFLMEWVDPPFCAGHWGPELVEIAGGFDPLGRKHQKSVQIEWEQVLQVRPEVIVLALCGYDAARAERDLELLRTYPHFNTLPAARENRIHLVDANSFFARPGPRIVESLELLAGILHPEQLPRVPESLPFVGPLERWPQPRIIRRASPAPPVRRDRILLT